MYLLLNENNWLDAQKMFVSLAIFNIIRRPLAFFPQLITSSMMFMVSMKRIGEFLDSMQDADLPVVTREPPLRSQLQKKSPSIKIRECTFSWFATKSVLASSTFRLSKISLKITEPKLYCIIGEIGSGKS